MLFQIAIVVLPILNKESQVYFYSGIHTEGSEKIIKSSKHPREITIKHTIETVKYFITV